MPDGRIVVSGYASKATNDQNDTIIARYNPDGTLDSTTDATPGEAFDGDGKLLADLANNKHDYGEGLVLQDGGRVVVVSGVQRVADTNEYDFGLARFNVDGSNDGTFGEGGMT